MHGEKVPDAVNEKYESLFREYIVVGGMPEVVAAFIKDKSFHDVKIVQNKILAAYDDDIANHTKQIKKAKIRLCYSSLPAQLARENKRFSYAQVEKRQGPKNMVTA